MRYFLLDTNILIAYLKADNHLYTTVSQDNQLDKEDAIIMISVITKAEIRSLALQNNWGGQKIATLKNLLNSLIVIDVNAANDILLNAYAEIDAYSHNRHPSKTYDGSARTMAKNDIWIAATALATNATLLTTDNDFNHLNSVFLEVKKYDVSSSG
jgi:predicted nucleic acid-binding protein